MTRLIHTRKAKVPILPHLTILCAVYDHGLVPRGAELCAVRVF
jgi:hypothetical protein